MIIGVQQRPEVSDHDFVEEQERNLQSLCIRTMALPVGRGAMAFQCAAPLPTEPVRRTFQNLMKFLFLTIRASASDAANSVGAFP